MKHSVAVTAIVVAGLTGCSSPTPAPQTVSSTASSSQAEGGRSPAASFQVGDCIDQIPRGANHVTVVDCSKPHAAEVFAVFLLPDGPFPGAAAVQEVKQKCTQDALVGYSPSEAKSPEVHTTRKFPDEKSWALGDRSVTCMVTSDPPTTGSLRGH